MGSLVVQFDILSPFCVQPNTTNAQDDAGSTNIDHTCSTHDEACVTQHDHQNCLVEPYDLRGPATVHYLTSLRNTDMSCYLCSLVFFRSHQERDEHIGVVVTTYKKNQKGIVHPGSSRYQMHGQEGMSTLKAVPSSAESNATVSITTFATQHTAHAAHSLRPRRGKYCCL